jgi:prephenate dehydratase
VPATIGYFGPEGTFTHEALVAASAGRDVQLVPYATIYATVLAVEEGTVAQALVPIENSLEGSVNATLDTLALATDRVAIVGELVHPIHQCLIARAGVSPEQVQVVVSHAQPLGQCARFLRDRLPQAQVMAAASTAEAVRLVASRDEPWAALGNRLAAELHGCEVLLEDVQDEEGNETRFVWLARVGADGATPVGAPGGDPGPWKTAIVFWGVGSEAPGWLVACLSDFAARSVNLTRIESRPRRRGLGSYMFFTDLEGRDSDPDVAAALQALRAHVEVLRVLGSFPIATTPPLH